MVREARSRPGPKPKRLYVRWVRQSVPDPDEQPTRRELEAYWANLDRVGRLVAVGETTEPVGELLLLRAIDLDEATRVLRVDPWRGRPGALYELLEWNPRTVGAGVNLETAPERGSGRLTALDRVTVVVRDQVRALAWYETTLGLAVRSQDPATNFVELSLGRGASALSLVEPRPDWGEPYYTETLARVGGATGIAFQTDSVSALEARLRRGGARITAGPERQPWGGTTLRFADPDGNEFLAFQVTTDPDAPTSAPSVRTAASASVRWTRRPPRSKAL